MASQNKNGADWERRHSSFTIIISCILAVLTLIAVCMSLWSNIQTSRSLAIADSTFKLTKKSIESGDAKDSSLISIANSTSNAAIRSADAMQKSAEYSRNMLTEYKDEFKKDNEPILQIHLHSIEAPKLNQKLAYSYYFENYGKKTAKILSIAITTAYSDMKIDSVMKHIKAAKTKDNPDNLYVNGRSITYFGSSEHSINEEYYNGLASGKMYILMVGKVEYENLNNSRKRIYEFQYQLLPPFVNNVSGGKVIYQNNYDVK